MMCQGECHRESGDRNVALQASCDLLSILCDNFRSIMGVGGLTERSDVTVWHDSSDQVKTRKREFGRAFDTRGTSSVTMHAKCVEYLDRG